MNENIPNMSTPGTGGIAPGRPSRIWYWLGSGIIVAGMIAAALWIVVGMGGLSNEIDSFQRVPVGGSGEVLFSTPGSYVIYYEGGQGVSPGFQAAVEPLDGGRAEAPADYNGDLNYDLGGHAGHAVGTIRILEPGRFKLDTTTTSDDDGGQLALGPPIGRELVSLVVGALALGFGSCIVGATTLIVTAVKRRKRPAPTATWPTTTTAPNHPQLS